MFGAAAVFSIFAVILIYSANYHKILFKAIWNTEKKVAYGIYSSLWEMLFCHYWFLLRSACQGKHRQNILSKQIKSIFLKRLNRGDEDEETQNVVITHSCRTIFYCIIKSLLDNKEEDAITKKKSVTICCATMQFGSFYRLIRSMEMDGKYEINFYEIDLKLSDCTLDIASINESEVSKCDLILCQHFFGVPFEQEILFKFGKKYNIPILEDCVQSGSLFGQYKGHKSSDVILYSCGLDKTPSCFGGGLGYFYNTKNGQYLYDEVNSMLNTFAVDKLRDRFTSLLNQTIHLIITRNHFRFNTMAGIVGYFLWYRHTKTGMIKWYDISLRVRQTKSITPFQHKSGLFLTKPSIAQLYSIRYGLTKRNYNNVILNEIQKRDLFLNNIPKRYHEVLFPWLTKKVLDGYKQNKGIGEFTWVYSKNGNRIELNDYLCNNYIVTLINTTWCYHTKLQATNGNNSKFLCDNITYLPNINEMNHKQIKHCAKVLTAYCESKKN